MRAPPVPSLLLLTILSGCGPTLRQGESFTPQRVKEVVFDDTCKLQEYFDTNPPPMRPESETRLGNRDGDAVGRATFVVGRGKGGEVFRRLLSDHYRGLPRLSGDVRMTVEFYSSGGPPRMLIGAHSQLEVRDTEISLPYHPCVGFFFFGRDRYVMRRQLLSQNSL